MLRAKVAQAHRRPFGLSTCKVVGKERKKENYHLASQIGRAKVAFRELSLLCHRRRQSAELHHWYTVSGSQSHPGMSKGTEAKTALA
jgi:hypothetical protein